MNWYQKRNEVIKETDDREMELNLLPYQFDEYLENYLFLGKDHKGTEACFRYFLAENYMTEPGSPFYWRFIWKKIFRSLKKLIWYESNLSGGFLKSFLENVPDEKKLDVWEQTKEEMKKVSVRWKFWGDDGMEEITQEEFEEMMKENEK